MWWHLVQHWLAVHTGSLNMPGVAPGNAFFGGIGSDFSEVLILGGLAAFLRRHNCAVHRCWRLGRHQTAAGHHVCRKHHPDDHLTAEHVLKAHHDALKGNPA